MLFGEGKQVTDPDVVLRDVMWDLRSVGPTIITIPQKLETTFHCFYLLSSNSDRMKAAVCLSYTSFWWKKPADDLVSDELLEDALAHGNLARV